MATDAQPAPLPAQSPAPSPPQCPAEPFGSLAQLREEHGRLLKAGYSSAQPSSNVDAPEHVSEIVSEVVKFLARVRATGAILDAPSDREAAQSVLDYWTATLFTLQRRISASTALPANLPDTADAASYHLVDFDPATIDAAMKAADEWLDHNPADDALARRIVLRLLRLRTDADDQFELITASDTILDDLGTPEDVRRVLNQLETLGIVRVQVDSPDRRRLSLRSPRLASHWPRIERWKKDRSKFRQLAIAWQNRRRLPGDGKASRGWFAMVWAETSRLFLALGGALYDLVSRVWKALVPVSPAEDLPSEDEFKEAWTYRDLNPVELQLLSYKQRSDEELRRWQQSYAMMATIAVIATICGLVIALRSNYLETAQKHKSRLEVGLAQLDEGLKLMDNNRDVSGAMVFIDSAIARFDESGHTLPGDEQKRIKKSLLLAAGMASYQLPRPISVATQEKEFDPNKVSVSTISSTGEVALTAALKQDELASKIWRPTSRGKWEHTEVETLKADFGRGPLLSTFLSPSGDLAIAAVVSSAKKSQVWLYVLETKQKRPAWQPLSIPEEKCDSDSAMAVCENEQRVVTDVKFGPDDKTVAAAILRKSGADATSVLLLWDVKQPKTPQTFDPKAIIGGVAFGSVPGSPANESAISHPLVAVALANDPQGSRFVCRAWIYDGKYQSKDLRWRTDSPHPAASSPDEKMFITFAPKMTPPSFWMGNGQVFQCELKEFDPEKLSWEAKSKPVVTEGAITSVELAPTGDFMAAITSTNQVPLILQSFKTPRLEWPHAAQVNKATFSSDGRFLATASRDRRVLIHDVMSGKLVFPPLPHAGSVADVRFSADDRSIVTVCEDTVLRWSLPWAARPMGVVPIPSSWNASRTIHTTAISSDGKWMAACGALTGYQWNFDEKHATPNAPNGWARVWSVETGEPASEEIIHDRPLQNVAVSSSTHLFVCTLDNNNDIQLWDTRGKKRGDPLLNAGGNTIFFAFGRNESQPDICPLIAIRQLEGKTRLQAFSIRSDGEVIKTGDVQCDNDISSAAFDPKCEHVAGYSTRSGLGRALVWKVGDEKTVVLTKMNAVSAHREPITHAAFSRDGNRLVTTSRDDTAIVWTRSTNGWLDEALPTQDERQRARHTADVIQAVFLDDQGETLTTADNQGRVIVWERKGRKYYTPTELSTGEKSWSVVSLIAVDGRHVLTSHVDRRIRLWNVEQFSLVATRHSPDDVRHIWCATNSSKENVIYFLNRKAAPAAPPKSPITSYWSGLLSVYQWPVATGSPSGMSMVLAARGIKDKPFRLVPTTTDEIKSATSPTLGEDMSALERARWHAVAAMECELAEPPNWGAAKKHWEALADEELGNEWLRKAQLGRVRSSIALGDWEEAEKLQKAAAKKAPNLDVIQVRADGLMRRALEPSIKEAQPQLREARTAYDELFTGRSGGFVTTRALANLAGHFPYTEELHLEKLSKLIDAAPNEPEFRAQRAMLLGQKPDVMAKQQALEDSLVALRNYATQRHLKDGASEWDRARKLLAFEPDGKKTAGLLVNVIESHWNSLHLSARVSTLDRADLIGQIVREAIRLDNGSWRTLLKRFPDDASLGRVWAEGAGDQEASLLRSVLNSNDKDFPPSAKQVVFVIGPKMPDEIVRPLRNDAAPVLKVAYVRALGTTVVSGAAEEAQVSGLARFLSDELPETRRVAAKVLGNLGRRATPALKSLEACLTDSDAGVKKAAETALNQIRWSGNQGPLQIPGELTSDDLTDQHGRKMVVHMVTLKRGRTYQIDLRSPAWDNYLRLERPYGKVLDFDDDSGGNLNARLVFAPMEDGEHCVVATSYRPEVTGTFTLIVTPLP